VDLAGLLRLRVERPRHRAAQQRDELAAFHHEEFATHRLDIPSSLG
jgi:hypothetical protein